MFTQNQEVSLSDYSFQDGFGSQADNAELLKAMQAGQITGRDTADLSLTQEPLKAESLETALKLLSFRMQDIRLWNSIPKMPAYNTVEEFLQLESYGSDRGGFYDEGALSDVEDSSYIRRSELVKYIQVTGEVTYQAQIVKSYVPAMQQEIKNKMMWVLRKANSALTKGNSATIPQEWNSLYAQHASIGNGEGFSYSDLDSYMNENPAVIDLRGGSLTQEMLEDGAVNIDDAFGTATDIFGPPTTISDLSKSYYEKQRILLGASGQKVDGGSPLQAMSTSLGQVNLSHDKFMKRNRPRKLSDGAISDGAPVAPSVAKTVALTGTADASSKFAAGDAGTVYYAVASMNSKGESALSLLDSMAVTLTAGRSVDLGFTAVAAATGYQVYRTKVTASSDPAADGVTFYPLFEVSKAQHAAGFDGAAAAKIRDRNRYLPDTEQAFMIQKDDEVFSFKQLAPLSKLDLAILAMSRRFIVFLFGTPNLYANKKMVRYINIGRYTAA